MKVNTRLIQQSIKTDNYAALTKCLTNQHEQVTALCFSLFHGYHNTALSLIDEMPGFLFNLHDDEYGKTALHLAVNMQNLECVRLMLAKGADQEVKCHKGFTAFQYAEQIGNSELIKILLEYKKEIFTWFCCC